MAKKQEELIAFSVLAEELQIDQKKLVSMIQSNNLPTPMLFDAIQNEFYYSVEEAETIKNGLSRLTVDAETFFASFGDQQTKKATTGKRGRPAGSKNKDKTEDHLIPLKKPSTGKKRGRPRKEK